MPPDISTGSVSQQDLLRLFPGVTVKYTESYYRLTNRFTDDDLIVLLLQEPVTAWV